MRTRIAFHGVLVCMTSLAITLHTAEGQAQSSVSSASPADPFAAGSIAYSNHAYGFSFTLPAGWKGFTIVEKSWSGSKGSNADADRGPLILIRHPLWTEANPREDIPIMVFTRDQWRMVQKEALLVSAAPFPPAEISHNRKYVFATPPRYSYDELEGVDEVGRIVNSRPIHSISITKKR